MSIQQMREALKTLYNKSTTWVSKVNRMSDQQITAVYLRAKRDGKLN